MTIMPDSTARLAPSLALGAILAGIPATSALAQHRFPQAPAVDSADFARYPTPEHCLAAAYRIRNDLADGTRRDTLMYDVNEQSPAAVSAAARRCGARFTPSTVDPRDLLGFFLLALEMGHDSLAGAVAEHRLASVAASDTARRLEILQQTFDGYMAARPIRVPAARRVAAALDALAPAGFRQRLHARAELMEYAWEVLDTAQARIENRAWLALAAQASPEDRERGLLDMYSVKVEGELIMLDSIGNLDPDTYIAGFRAKLKEKFAVSEATLDSMLFVGRPAGPLAGDFWFPRLNPAQTRPMPGRWSLLVWIDPRCGAGCYREYAVLKRLHRRYGADLDITLIAQTRGYMRALPPPGPAEEADMIREYVFDHLGLPGVLTVTATPFDRLPAPDRRRFDRSVPNEVDYGVEGFASLNRSFLVGPRGRIVHEVQFFPSVERQLHFILDAFLKRSSRQSEPDSRPAPVKASARSGTG